MSGDADGHAGALLVSAHPVQRGNTGGGKPPPPMFSPVGHDVSVKVPKFIAQVHSAMQEGGRAEATAFGG